MYCGLFAKCSMLLHQKAIITAFCNTDVLHYFITPLDKCPALISFNVAQRILLAHVQGMGCTGESNVYAIHNQPSIIKQVAHSNSTGCGHISEISLN